MTRLSALLVALSFNVLPAECATTDLGPYERALLLDDNEKFKEALQLLNPSIEADSKHADSYVLRGHLYMSLDQYDRAIQDFDKAQQLGSRLDRLYSWRGFCYMKLHQYQKGIEDLTKAIKLHPVDFWDVAKPQDYENLAIACRKIQRPDLLVKDEQVLAALVKMDEARKKRFSGEIANAEAMLDECVALDPGHPSSWMMRGIVHSNEREFWKAIGDFTRVIQMIPDNPAAYYFRADAYEELGEHRRAIDDYTKIIELNPRIVVFRYICETGRLREHFDAIDWQVTNIADIFYLRAKCKANLGLIHEAIEDLDHSIKLAPGDNIAYSLRADMILSEGRSQRALADYTHAIKLEKNDWKAYYQRASAYEKIGDFKNAIDDCSRIISINPKDAGAYLLRARLYDKLDQHELAIADYSSIIKIHPDDDDAFRCRGETYYKMGQHQNAIDDLTEAVRIDPINAAFAYELRAKAYAALGKSSQAKEDELKAVDADNKQEMPALKKISPKQLLFFSLVGIGSIAALLMLWVIARKIRRFAKTRQ